MSVSFRYYKTGILITVIILLFIIFSFLIDKINIPIENITEDLDLNTQVFVKSVFRIILEPLSAIGLISILLYLYNRYLWRYTIFNLMVRIPDLNGRYSGKVFSDFKKKTQKNCVLEIKQTASKIKLFLYIKNSNPLKMTSSESILENIQKREDGFYKVCFTYYNIGDKVSRSIGPHFGYNELKYIPLEKKLEGPYYTHPERGRQGVVEVKFKTKEIKGGY